MAAGLIGPRSQGLGLRAWFVSNGSSPLGSGGSLRKFRLQPTHRYPKVCFEEPEIVSANGIRAGATGMIVSLITGASLAHLARQVGLHLVYVQVGTARAPAAKTHGVLWCARVHTGGRFQPRWQRDLTWLKNIFYLKCCL